MIKNLVGIGYDIHKLKKGRRLILGGVRIPFPLGLDGHSDADCLTHSIIDALAGAANKGDIGTLFGSNRPEYKDVSSLILLGRVWNILKKNYRIGNIDTIIVAEKPKLSHYVLDMKKNIAEVLKINEALVSIKATTAKGIGDIGTSKAVVSYAVVNIYAKR